MNFIKLKKIIFLTFAVIASSLVFAISLSISNKPEIKNINIDNITNFSFNTSIEAESNIPSEPSNKSTFDYKVIGYRSGGDDSSVILKKGNNEYVVSKGDKLVGKFELIEVNENEVIFRDGEKLYKIKNLGGK